MADIDRLIFTLDADLAPLRAKLAEAQASVDSQGAALSQGYKKAAADLDVVTAKTKGYSTSLMAALSSTDGFAAGQRAATPAVVAATAALSAGEKAAAATGAAHAKLGVSTLALREPFTLMREAVNGNFSRMVGSTALLAQGLGVLPLIMTGVGAGVVGMTAAFVGFLVAQAKFDASQRDLTIALRAGGDATGYSRGQLEGLAQELSATGDVSAKAARTIEGEFARTGRIGGQVFVDLAKATADYAAMTGETTDKAGANLAKMFSDPAKGAKELDAAYNLLSAAQIQNIQNLAEQGNKGAAQAALLAALTQRSKGLADEGLGYLARAARATGQAFNDLFDSIGKIGAPQSTGEQISGLEQKIASRKSNFPGALSFLAPTSGMEADLENAQELQRKEQQQAAQRQQDAANRDLGKQADTLASAYEPVSTHIEKLKNDEQALADVLALGAEKAGLNADQFKRVQAAYEGVKAAIPNVKTPLEEANARLSIEREVNALPPSQRPQRRAFLTTQLSAGQNPQTAADAGAIASDAQSGAQSQASTAARDAVTQADLNAKAQARLATAAGLSSDAMRKAANDNQVAAFAYQHGGIAVDQYRKAIEAASESERKRELSATVLGLNQSADASERLAAAQKNGALAAHQATLENAAFAVALKAGAQGSAEFAAAYNEALDAIKRKDVADTSDAVLKELQTRKDSLAIAKLEGQLIGGNVELRGAEVAMLKEKLRIQQQFPGEWTAEKQALLDTSAAEGKQIAINDEKKQSERDFQQIVRSTTNDIISQGLAAVRGTKSWKDALSAVEQTLLKIGDQAVSQYITKQLVGGGGGSGSGGGGLGALGGIFGAAGGLFGRIFGGSSGAVDSAGYFGSTGAVGASAADLPAFTSEAAMFHTGGVVGIGGSPRTVPSNVFAFAPRLHSGLAPDEFPAILQRGERVTPKGGASGSGGHTINFGDLHVHGGDQKTADRFGRTMTQSVVAALDEADRKRERFG
jgi:phage-related minor tail protein